ncbi:MAG TPA: copper resistance protein CopC [Nocardioides sp.]|nr:copper resistance protein CopC [Nocardioides sp.]
MILRQFVVVAVVALSALLGGGAAPAAAHPNAIQSTPEAGSVAPEAPKAISIALSEPAVARGSTLEVTGPGGKVVATGPVTEKANGQILSVEPRATLPSAIYTVRWSALGDDGHVVSGSFRFGVATANGDDPPGAASLTGAGQRPDSSAAGDSAIRWTARWAGILVASVLFAGLLLLHRLRRADDIAPAAESKVLRFAPTAWLVTVLAALAGALTSATAGATGEFDLRLLTDSATGRADLARLGFVGVATVALLLVRRRQRARFWVGLAAAGGVLASYAFSGHVLTEPSVPYLVAVVVHVLAAGLWLGGLGAIALASRVGGVDVRTALRRYAAIAIGALVVVVLTGVTAAVREVAHWYFLTWSGYGRVVLAKSALVVVIAAIGLLAWRRSRGDRPAGPGRAVGLELVVGVVVLALAVTLGALVQGRERPLPAQVGRLFAGPAAATAVLESGTAAVGLAPARVGDNVLTVSLPPEEPTATEVSVVLTGPGQREHALELERRGGRTWSAPVDVSTNGQWRAELTVDGGDSAQPVALEVGVPEAPGATPVNVIAVADLTGPAAERCRAHVIGVQMALARLNADGGLDGGRKVALLTLDSGGTAEGAEKAVARALRAGGVASAGTCGGGGSEAVEALADAGIPVVVGDPAVDPTETPDVFRLVADPFAQGIALGQLIRGRVQPTGVAEVPVVRALVADDLQGRRLLAGLRIGLTPEAAPKGFADPSARPTPEVVQLEPGALADLDDRALTRVIDARRTTALVVDLPNAGGPDVAAIERLGRSRGDKILTAPLLLSERVLSETVVRASGALGHLGAVQGVSEVSTSSTDAVLYRMAVPQLFRGELPSLDGLRGYAAGRAIAEALETGTSPEDVVAYLSAPDVFSSALLAPWSRRKPGLGSTAVVPLQPQFLAPTLVPGSTGGERQDDSYFPEGNWTVTSTAPLGLVPGLGPSAPVPR